MQQLCHNRQFSSLVSSIGSVTHLPKLERYISFSILNCWLFPIIMSITYIAPFRRCQSRSDTKRKKVSQKETASKKFGNFSHFSFTKSSAFDVQQLVSSIKLSYHPISYLPFIFSFIFVFFSLQQARFSFLKKNHSIHICGTALCAPC